MLNKTEIYVHKVFQQHKGILGEKTLTIGVCLEGPKFNPVSYWQDHNHNLPAGDKEGHEETWEDRTSGTRSPVSTGAAGRPGKEAR